jgi:hypothetical protein
VQALLRRNVGKLPRAGEKTFHVKFAIPSRSSKWYFIARIVIMG